METQGDNTLGAQIADLPGCVGLLHSRRSAVGLAELAVCLAGLGMCGASGAAQASNLKPGTLEHTRRATVMVFTAASEHSRGDRSLETGSGFFINGSGLMITNNHVIDPTHLQSEQKKQQFHYEIGRLSWSVVTDAGTDNYETWNASVVYQNEMADQAVLQVYDGEGHNLRTPRYLRLLPESRLRKRMKLWAFGFPGGDRQRGAKGRHPKVSVAVGHVLDLPRTPAGRIRMIYTDVVARPGSSGGPIVDADGLVVGTVTLMRKPEGRADTGGANYSALVPAKLTGEMVRVAFDLAKIPPNTDVTPFVGLLSQDDGRVNIPEYARLVDRDVLFFDDGDRIYGTIGTESITWESALGPMEVPTDTIAYVLNNESGAHLFLEGGNHIAASMMDSTFVFEPDGGTAAEHKLGSVGVIGFRLSDRRLKPVRGRTVLLDTDVCQLVLSDVRGTVQFDGKIGEIGIDLEDVLRLDRKEDGQHVLTMRDGRRMTGTFGDGTYEASIAATGTRLEFRLGDLSRAHVEVRHAHPGAVAGLGLAGVLGSADPDIRHIADTLQAGELQESRARIDAMFAPARFKRLPEVKKEQVRLLDAVAKLREGRASAAVKAFRPCIKATDHNVTAYAHACNEVLRHYTDFQFKRKPLSDRGAFAEAGAALAKELIKDLRSLLDDAQTLEGRTRTEYVRSINAARKHEKAMKVAAVFAGEAADDELIRLWNFVANVCQRELRRLGQEIEQQDVIRRGGSRRSAGNRGRGPRADQLAADRKIKEMEGQMEEVEATLRAYLSKSWEYGFRIEDPDIQAHGGFTGDGPDDEP